MEGYVKLWRKTLESSMWENHNLLVFWIWCLLKATYKERIGKVEYQDVPLVPGQFIFGRRKAAKETRLSERTIRTCCRHLENMGNLTIKTTQRFSVISIANWAKYQEEATQQATHQRPTDDPPATTDKKGKKGKKVKKGIYVQLFNLFWKEYPKKKSKKDAEREFSIAIKGRTNGYTEESFADMLIEAVRVVKKTEDWNRNNGQYIPLPSTWLHGEKWTDEISKTQPTGRVYKDL